MASPPERLAQAAEVQRDLFPSHDNSRPPRPTAAANVTPSTNSMGGVLRNDIANTRGQQQEEREVRDGPTARQTRQEVDVMREFLAAHRCAGVPKPIPYPGEAHVYVEPRAEDEQLNICEHLSDFRCAICFDFPPNPSKCCGNCITSRYCYHCLLCVLQAPNMSDECPTCREPFTSHDIVFDEDCLEEMKSPDKIVPCKYMGCNGNFTLNEIFAHQERSCEYAPVQCGHSKIGCPWIGTRLEYPTHEATCAFKQMADTSIHGAQEGMLMYSPHWDGMPWGSRPAVDFRLSDLL